MFIVEFPGGWYLRNTVATGDVDRATRFPTKDAAQAALDKAAKFMKRSAVKASQIVPAPAEHFPTMDHDLAFSGLNYVVQELYAMHGNKWETIAAFPEVETAVEYAKLQNVESPECAHRVIRVAS